MSALEFPLRMEAHEPPEVRGEGRDDVALLVATRHDLALVHARFRDLPQFLSAGDLLVVNASATLAAALETRLGEQPLQLWLSAPAPDGAWLVELRTGDRRPYPRPPLGVRLELPGGAHAELVARFAGSDRLAVARFELAEPLEDYLRRHGQPIRYGYVPEPWPLEAYQTVFAREPGSAEMPSAGRPFTAELVTELVARGVLVAPVILHTGVSSLEHGEPPFPERYHVPAATARLVNAVHGWNGRVIAVGTTVVRALETWRQRTAPYRRGRDGRVSSSRRSAGCARSTACSADCTSASLRTLSCSRPRPVPSSLSAPTRPRSRTATCGTSSATST